MAKLNLGRELSKNEQKKILGGAVEIYCEGGTVFTTSIPNCASVDEEAYCHGTMRGHAIYPFCKDIFV